MSAAALTGLLHLVFKQVGAKGAFIALAGFSWMVYILWRVREDRTVWNSWGFRTDNLVSAFLWPTVLVVLAGSGMAGYAVATGRPLWQEHIVNLLLVYPFWGLLQQFLVQAMGVNNLYLLFPSYGYHVAIPAGVGLFAVVHFPNWQLMLATGLLGCVFIPLYLRDRNLWPLGLYHGWLGAMFYLWVLGRDPWVSVFGR